MPDNESLPLGIVLERRKSQSRWAEFSWLTVAVIPGAAEIDDWAMLRQEDDWTHFHIATLPLELFPKETEGYRYNLSCDPPVVFVVLREGEEAGEPDIVPALVTVCPYEAQDYLDTGEEQVDSVEMPASIRAWVASFVEKHHVDEPFKKRKRKRWESDNAEGETMPPGGRSARRGYGDA